MTATWLGDALRAGGVAVDEHSVPDWKQRGHTDGPFSPIGVMGHHTAGPATGDLPSLGTVRDGRPDLGGPLSNLMLSRAGVWVCIAAGRCWHAGAADDPRAWPWVPNGDGNGYLLGVEAESTGHGDWTAAQLAAYPKGVAALLTHMGAPPSHFIGHLEWAPTRKIDPAGWPGGMAGFRATISAHPAPVTPTAHPDSGWPSILRWNLPAGHYYGNIRGPAKSHGGINAAEKLFVRNVQQWLIRHGVAKNHFSWTWASNPWADGVWGPETDVAMSLWHARFYPGQPNPAQCWSDDYSRLTHR